MAGGVSGGPERKRRDKRERWEIVKGRKGENGGKLSKGKEGCFAEFLARSC